MKNDVFEAKSSQDGSWGDLGSILVAKRGRLGAPKRPQISPKSRPKIDQILDRFLIDFWGDLGARGLAVGGRGAGRPLYFPYGSTIDFEEIECNIL